MSGEGWGSADPPPVIPNPKLTHVCEFSETRTDLLNYSYYFKKKNAHFFGARSCSWFYFPILAQCLATHKWRVFFCFWAKICFNTVILAFFGEETLIVYDSDTGNSMFVITWISRFHNSDPGQRNSYRIRDQYGNPREGRLGDSVA